MRSVTCGTVGECGRGTLRCSSGYRAARELSSQARCELKFQARRWDDIDLLEGQLCVRLRAEQDALFSDGQVPR